MTTNSQYSRPYSPKELAKLFGRSWRTVRRLIRARRIRAQRLHEKAYRIHPADLPPEANQ